MGSVIGVSGEKGLMVLSHCSLESNVACACVFTVVFYFF